MSAEEIRALAERMAAAFASQISASERVGRVIRNFSPIEETTQPPRKQIPSSPRAVKLDDGTRKTVKIGIH
jgi:hypothetical protein